MCDVVWLDVWEKNLRAIEFYRRWGFVEVGTQGFVLGSDVQHDLLMQKRWPGAVGRALTTSVSRRRTMAIEGCQSRSPRREAPGPQVRSRGADTAEDERMIERKRPVSVLRQSCASGTAWLHAPITTARRRPGLRTSRRAPRGRACPTRRAWRKRCAMAGSTVSHTPGMRTTSSSATRLASQAASGPSNKARVEKLIHRGRMTTAGIQKVEAAKANGQWDAAAQREDPAWIPPGLRAALVRRAGALDAFRALPPSVRQMHSHAFSSAKRPETRARRAQAAIDEALNRAKTRTGLRHTSQGSRRRAKTRPA